MSDVSVNMTLPLDDGFLRRECPNCEREFKWLHTDEASTEEPREPVPDSYYCPYCHELGDRSAWWTKAQLEFAKATAYSEVLQPELQTFKRDIEALNRPGGFVRMNIDLPAAPQPEQLVEPSDMVRVDLPCHLEEPLKIDEAWAGDVACMVCGIRYPVDLVKTLE